MKHLLTIMFAAAAYMLPHSAQSQDKVRFPELGPEQLTPVQKKWDLWKT